MVDWRQQQKTNIILSSDQDTKTHRFATQRLHVLPRSRAPKPNRWPRPWNSLRSSSGLQRSHTSHGCENRHRNIVNIVDTWDMLRYQNVRRRCHKWLGSTWKSVEHRLDWNNQAMQWDKSPIAQHLEKCVVVHIFSHIILRCSSAFSNMQGVPAAMSKHTTRVAKRPNRCACPLHGYTSGCWLPVWPLQWRRLATLDRARIKGSLLYSGFDRLRAQEPNVWVRCLEEGCSVPVVQGK